MYKDTVLKLRTTEKSNKSFHISDMKLPKLPFGEEQSLDIYSTSAALGNFSW